MYCVIEHGTVCLDAILKYSVLFLFLPHVGIFLGPRELTGLFLLPLWGLWAGPRFPKD